MKLQIRPLTTLCDERINIRISDLPPFGKVKTSASMSFSTPLKIAPRLVFSEGVTWEANAQMLEDSWEKNLEFFKK